MDAELTRLAERQGGLLVCSQVREHGLDTTTLRRWAMAGEVVRLTRGLYALATHRETTAEGRHLQLARGALLLMPDAVLSHWTALLAHGVPVLGVPRMVRLRRPIHRQVRHGAFLVDPWRGEPVRTDLGDAVPVGQAILEQSRLRGLEAGLVSADAALHSKAVSTDALAEQASQLKGPGARVARRTAALADGRVESVGESRLRYACVVGGVEVIPQATIRTHDGEFVARVDFLVKDTNVVLEFDGRVKYADGDGRTLWNEKNREDALRRLGYVVVRVTWDDLANPAEILERIRKASHHTRAAAG